VGSQPGGGHETPVIDWVAVYIMLAGCCALGVAMPLKSWWIAIAGGVVLLVGAGIAVAAGIMNHTEDYEVRPKPDDTPAVPASHTHRITSA
jgi:protein-S-isoprenylcysteine O-methyltransferase Ste14